MKCFRGGTVLCAVMFVLITLAGCMRSTTYPDWGPGGNREIGMQGDDLNVLGPGSMAPPVVKLTNAEVHDYAQPHVSFDGKWLAYAATINRTQADIFVQMLDGGRAARQITSGGSNIQPAISPDSMEVAFASDRDGKYRIYIAPVSRTGATEEISPCAWEAVSPTWSPDGMRIAFAAREDSMSPWMICVRDRVKGHLSILTEGNYPDWSPYGEHIAFQRVDRQEPGYTSIYTVRADGNELTQVYHADTHGAITPAWAGGDWILFATVNKSVASRMRKNYATFNADDVWIVKRDGTQASVVTVHRAADWDPCYDNQNRRVVFVSARDGVQNIYAAPSNLSGPRSGGYEGLFGMSGGR